MLLQNKTNLILGDTGRNVVCEEGGVIILLYCYCVQFAALHSKKNKNKNKF